MNPGAERRRPTRRFALLALAVVLLALLFVRLGFWQLDRHRQRAAFNLEVAEAARGEMLRLEGAQLARLREEPGAFAYRQAVAAGTPRPAEAFLLRGRMRAGQPGVHLLLPLVLEDGSVLVVDRGWIPSADGVRAEPWTYLEELPERYLGLLFPLHPEEGRARPLEVQVDGREVLTLARLEIPDLATHLAAEPFPLYLRELPGGDRADPPLPSAAPQPDGGPHLSYAVQWFSFALIALIGLLVLWTRRLT
jgi:surfeit locus 1 family protein